MITPAQFAAFVTNVETMIGAVYDQDDVESVANKIASTVPCSSSQLTLGWTGLMPKMRPWFGARQPHEPAPQTYTVQMVPYENTYAVDRFQLDDDQYGVLYRMLPDMARQSKRQPDYEIRDLIEGSGIYSSATRQAGFDGLTHWNSAHPIDIYNASAGTYTNSTLGGQSVGGVTIGGALSPTSFTSVFEYMRTIKGEDGERLGVRMTHLMIPVTLRAEAELILKSTFFAPPSWGAYSPVYGQVGAADNPLKRFGVEIIENQFLSSNVNWYGLDLSKAFKPFLWVVREATRMVPMTQENSWPVFNTHQFQWGQWNRISPAWDYAFLSHRSGPSA